MIPDTLYTPLYYQVMLLVVIACALLYWSKPSHPSDLRQFNLAATALFCVGVVLYMGLRPNSWIFIDMRAYGFAFERVQQGIPGGYNDPLFNGLMWLCAPFLSTKGWYVFCAFIYVVPLALAAWRVHGAWAFPVFLAFLTAFSFWTYGVNGIRNGLGTSVLILAFAFHDKLVLMLLLMAAACGIHGSVLLPAGAFLLVRYVTRTEVWLVFWAACAAISSVGNVGGMLLSLYNPFSFDNRAEGYILNRDETSGFRADFIAYSIIPVVVTLLLAAPTRARLRRAVARVRSAPAMKWMRKRSTTAANRMGRGRQLCLQGASPVGGVTGAGFAHLSQDPRRGLAGAEKRSGGQTVSARHAGVKQSGWSGLPWVRMLRSDPFYARLVNTYLLTNAAWILVIHAIQSNRFAYLSWFMMPWVLLYPFVPGRSSGRPRTGLIAAVLCTQYMFTYLMGVVIDPLRGR
jgi:hypothetical protein